MGELQARLEEAYWSRPPKGESRFDCLMEVVGLMTKEFPHLESGSPLEEVHAQPYEEWAEKWLMPVAEKSGVAEKEEVK